MTRLHTIDPEKVAIYIRWSTDDQADGTTLEMQQDGCRHYLLSQGWTFNQALLFIDDGHSGGNLRRPALTRLREHVRKGEVDCVVVFKLDRLSRSVVDMVNLVLEEWEGLTHVKSAREPVDTSSAMGKQFFYMLVSFAEWERSVIRERTTAGRRARAREGYKASARAPYGYRHGATKGSLAVEESEAPVIRRIFDLYTRGLGAKAIVVQLNAEGLRFRGGQMWQERTLLYLLSNPVYTGKMVYGRLARNQRRGKGVDEPFWLKSEEALVVEKSPFIPPLIPDELYALVQQVKQRRRVLAPGGTQVGHISPRAVSSPYLVTGLGRCRCGQSLYARTERRGAREYQHYACLGKKSRGRLFCAAANIPREALDREVEREILARYGDHVTRQRYRDVAVQGLEAEAAALAAAMGQVTQQLSRLEAEAKHLRREYREQAIDAAQFRALGRDLEEELSAVRLQRQQLGARRGALTERRQALGARLQAIGRVERWRELAPHEQKSLLQSFVASLCAWAEPDRSQVHLQITWHATQRPPV